MDAVSSLSAGESNLQRLGLFVQGHLELAQALARSDGPVAAARRLDAWAGQVQAQLAALGRDGPAPPHLHGLQAADLADARERLSSAASLYLARARPLAAGPRSR